MSWSQTAEDVVDKVLITIRPYSRGLAKFGVLFIHFQIAFLCMAQFSNLSLFIGFQLGINDRVRRATKNETGSSDSKLLSSGTHSLSMFLAILLLVSRVVSLVLLYLRKHVIAACVLLSIPSWISFVLCFNERMGYYSFFYISTFLSINGSLLMVAAETMEEKDLNMAGLPSLGENKRMSIMQLLARINIVLVFTGTQALYAASTSLHGEGSKIAMGVLTLCIAVPLLACVVVGYKTKVCSVALATYMFLLSIYAFPFFIHLAGGDTFRFWIESILFGFNAGGIGSLIYLAILGAGSYSVDHRKFL